MTTGEIGNHFKTTEKIDYLLDRSFIDFDLLIIDMAFMLPGNNSRNKEIYDKRKNDLGVFLKHKKIPLIIISPHPGEAKLIVHSQHQIFPLSSLLPIEEFEVTKETGQQLNILPNTLFSTFLLNYKRHFFYESFFIKHSGKILIETPHTHKILSFFNDSCIFLPRIRGFNLELEKQFLAELFLLTKQVQRNYTDREFPLWTNQYYLPIEEQIISEISDIQNQIENLSQTLEEKNKLLLEYKKKKLLVIGWGDELEFEIERIFCAIGFEILESEIGRDDLIIKYKERVAVVEIKGVNGSAAEKHAAQLEKWVANYYDKNEITAKGILIVNGFKDEELKIRNSVWPPQMIPYSTKREHCLLTSIQLLGMYYDIKNNQSNKEDIINSLFETVGIYPKFDDWSQFITYKETET